MQMKTVLCLSALCASSAAGTAWAQDANVPAAPSGDLEQAVNDAVWLTPTNNTRRSFQNPSRLRASGEDFAFDLDAAADWTRTKTHGNGEDKDVEFGATLTAVIDPRMYESRDDPSSHAMAIVLSATGVVGQEDSDYTSASRDAALFEAAFRMDFKKLTAEIGVGYGMLPHIRSADTFTDHAQVFTTFDLRKGKPWLAKTVFTQSELKDDRSAPQRRLTPYVGIEQTVFVDGPHGSSGRDFNVYYGVTYTHDLPQGFTLGVKPFARWDHDFSATESAIRGSVSHAVKLFKRDADVSLFAQFGHGTGHDIPQTAVVGIELEMKL